MLFSALHVWQFSAAELEALVKWALRSLAQEAVPSSLMFSFLVCLRCEGRILPERLRLECVLDRMEDAVRYAPQWDSFSSLPRTLSPAVRESHLQYLRKWLAQTKTSEERVGQASDVAFPLVAELLNQGQRVRL